MENLGESVGELGVGGKGGAGKVDFWDFEKDLGRGDGVEGEREGVESSEGYYSDSGDEELGKRMFEPGLIDEPEIRKFLIGVQRERRGILVGNSDCSGGAEIKTEFLNRKVADDQNPFKNAQDPLSILRKHNLHKDESNILSIFAETDKNYTPTPQEPTLDSLPPAATENQTWSPELFASSSNLAELIFGDLSDLGFKCFKEKT